MGFCSVSVLYDSPETYIQVFAKKKMTCLTYNPYCTSSWDGRPVVVLQHESTRFERFYCPEKVWKKSIKQITPLQGILNACVYIMHNRRYNLFSRLVWRKVDLSVYEDEHLTRREIVGGILAQLIL